MKEYSFVCSDAMEKRISAFLERSGRSSPEMFRLALSVLFYLTDEKEVGNLVFVKRRVSRKWKLFDRVLPPKYEYYKIVFPSPESLG